MSKQSFRRAVLAAPLFSLMFAVSVAAEASGGAEVSAGPTTPCEDNVWKAYNSCLMSSDTGWEKTLCDAAFLVQLRNCNS